MWKQNLWPNLDDDPNNPLYVWQGGQVLTDWWGWCLAVTAASFGAPGSSYSAKTAWQSCPTQHRDWQGIPEGKWVPLWWEGGDYGHVVFGIRSGNHMKIYSSPYTHKATFEIFEGELPGILNYIGNVYGVGAYSGWSETLLDGRIITYEPNAQPTPTPEPVPEPEPTPEPEPEPEPDPSDDNNNNGKDDDMSTPTEPIEPSEPAQHPDQQLVGGIIEEAGEWFEPSKTMKIIAYLVGDALLVTAILIPDIINAIQAPTPAIFGEYLAKVLLEAGTCVLMIFKLIKKK